MIALIVADQIVVCMCDACRPCNFWVPVTFPAAASLYLTLQAVAKAYALKSQRHLQQKQLRTCTCLLGHAFLTLEFFDTEALLSCACMLLAVYV